MSLPRWPVPAEGFEPTQWCMPPTGELKLRPQYRNGWIDKHVYTARQLFWGDRGSDWDIVAVAEEATPIPPLA